MKWTHRVDRRRGKSRAAGSAPLLALVLAGLTGLAASRADAKLLLTRDEALRQIFGRDISIVSRTAYLTDSQVETVRKKARAPFTDKRVTYYRVARGDSLLGTAFLDHHVVRTLTETVLVALDAAGQVRAVEVLAWNEPDDFRPPKRWLERARGLSEPQRARPGESMPHLAGATLTARAVTAAVRRSLALRETLEGSSAAR